MSHDGYRDQFYPADELGQAVSNNFLTKEEARLIYWSQFYALKQQAATVPPEIKS